MKYKAVRLTRAAVFIITVRTFPLTVTSVSLTEASFFAWTFVLWALERLWSEFWNWYFVRKFCRKKKNTCGGCGGAWVVVVICSLGQFSSSMPSEQSSWPSQRIDCGKHWLSHVISSDRHSRCCANCGNNRIIYSKWIIKYVRGVGVCLKNVGLLFIFKMMKGAIYIRIKSILKAKPLTKLIIFTYGQKSM